ncbi:RNA polymerase sigma factor [Georgenia halophila]|uniref:RNA polymerase sigma factor n=1 Tax=Georgenia halophila TaxID=620889 RepID=A0ABP8LC85_9MICO
MPDDVASAAAAAARDGYGRLVALLAAADGDIDAADDALADALERALLSWPDRGVPDNPHGWLLTVARNRLRDRWKSAEIRRTGPLDVDQHSPVHLDDIDPDAIPDKRLELMLVCAHPAISPTARTPLMLNTVLGFTAEQIARAFTVPSATMATRLVRAKRRIKDIRLPFHVPDRADLPGRMTAVLEAVYGAYVIEWSTAEAQPRPLPPEALRLAEILADLVPEDPEVRGLAALVQLSAARAEARTGPGGEFVPLDEQDPQRWDRARIERAHEHLRAAYARRALGRFQLEAAIQAVHCARTDGSGIDWQTLKTLHTSLQHLAPSNGGATALAAVRAETDGPAAALELLDEVADETHRFQPAWATRAHLLALLGRSDDAVAAYDKAISLTQDAAQRDYLTRRRAAVVR